jgi:hypothetical protein
VTAASELRDHGRLLVRRAVDRDDWISEALLDIAANGQKEWTPAQWDALLAEISGNDMSIDEFLDFYT